jgi:dTMP kinase
MLRAEERESMVGIGVFICIEGLDGCGKTTQARLLVRKLKKHYDVLYTAEPSRGTIGKFIKKNCLHAEKRGSVLVEALLFAADRVDHVQNEVLPALNKGRVMVSDRYVYSSYAYQGAAGLELKWIEKLNKHAIRPDLAIFIDVKPETVVQRLKRRKSVMEDLETQKKVREVYLKYVEKSQLVRLDGNKPKRAVAKDLFRIVKEFLEKSG